MSKWDDRETRDALYRKVLARWGAKDRVGKTAEECAECAAAIIRFQNSPAGSDRHDLLRDMLGEMTDVMITTEQMGLVFEGMTEELRAMRDAKLNRLESLLKEGKGYER